MPLLPLLHTLLLLLAVLCVVAVAARRLAIAPSILMVLAGIALALVPAVPAFSLAPELVLLGILPPLIYTAGFAMSWREFRFNLRPIALLAVGCVVFTTCAVALAAHWLLGMPLAAGFVLGAIVAPPDVVAPLAIARRLGLPRRILVILEGEGLANDATALILYRFAVAAVSSGVFALSEAAGTFVVVVAGELAYGIVVGWVSLRLRLWVRDPRVEMTLSLMTPYLAFWLPHHLGGSGVLATVATGLFVSWHGPLLIPAATRLQGVFFWDLVIYLLEGFLFLATGLQARNLLTSADSFSVQDMLLGVFVVATTITVARFVWVFPATYLPRWLSPALAARDPAPRWQRPFSISFIGIRGAVSLAAALALPLTDAVGQPFPERDVILIITFGVIVVTLIGQGLTLPPVIRWLGLARETSAERSRERKDEWAARNEVLNFAQGQLRAFASDGRADDGVLALLDAHHRSRVGRAPGVDQSAIEAARVAAQLRLELINTERQYIHELLRSGRLNDEARRRMERELDLEEAVLAVHDADLLHREN